MLTNLRIMKSPGAAYGDAGGSWLIQQLSDRARGDGVAALADCEA